MRNIFLLLLCYVFVVRCGSEPVNLKLERTSGLWFASESELVFDDSELVFNSLEEYILDLSPQNVGVKLDENLEYLNDVEWFLELREDRDRFILTTPNFSEDFPVDVNRVDVFQIVEQSRSRIKMFKYKTFNNDGVERRVQNNLFLERIE